jgi:hypothetical protein
MWFVWLVLGAFCLFLLAVNTVGVIILCLSVGAVLTTGNWFFALGAVLGLWLMMISE